MKYKGYELTIADQETTLKGKTMHKQHLKNYIYKKPQVKKKGKWWAVGIDKD